MTSRASLGQGLRASPLQQSTLTSGALVPFSFQHDLPIGAIMRGIIWTRHSDRQSTMERYKPRPAPRQPISERARRLISYAWILASLAIPVLGVAVIAGVAPSLAPGDEVSHVVRAGETLSGIALRYGVTVEDLVAANGLNNPNLIFVGQVLVIPRPSAAGGQIYTVRAGDTLSAIARRYGVSVSDLAAANGLSNPDAIFAGQRITIPVLGGSAPQVSREDMVYTLQRGDSLYRLSLIYGVPVDDLLAANDLASPNAVYPGLQIRIPATGGAAVADASPPHATASRIYVVRPGDTLSRIAVQFGVTVDGLVAANGITRPDRIYAGQAIVVPEAGAPARPAPARTATSHLVRPGETLSQIALRYGVTVHSLAVANNLLNPSRIYAGMVLSIPAAQAGANSVRYASVGAGLCADAEVTRSGTGYFIRPTHGYVISQNYSASHAGIDLAVGIGTSVFAADGGTVVYAGWNPVGYGNLVVLDHGNGWRTYYAHLSKVEVSCGEWVARGTVIGAVGSTGNSTGPHLHFELLRFGVAVNPTGYIRF